MKYAIVILFVLISTGFHCSKKNENKDICPADLTIISAQTPVNVIRGSDINISLECTGSDLCYSFSHVEIKKINELNYEIRTKGNYPCKAAICLQAIYYAHPTANIATSLAGQYTVRYYNNNLLFQTDTITVN